MRDAVVEISCGGDGREDVVKKGRITERRRAEMRRERRENLSSTCGICSLVVESTGQGASEDENENEQEERDEQKISVTERKRDELQRERRKRLWLCNEMGWYCDNLDLD